MGKMETTGGKWQTRVWLVNYRCNGSQGIELEGWDAGGL